MTNLKTASEETLVEIRDFAIDHGNTGAESRVNMEFSRRNELGEAWARGELAIPLWNDHSVYLNKFGII